MMRQKLAFVVCGPPSAALRRINGFSPVRITWFGSAAIFVLPCFRGKPWGGKAQRIPPMSREKCEHGGMRALRFSARRGYPAPVMANASCSGGASRQSCRFFTTTGDCADADRIVDLEHAERTQDQRRA